MVIKIGNTALPSPVSYSAKVKKEVTQNSKRSMNGVYNQEIVRAPIRTFSLKWEMLTGIQLSNILSAITPSTFTVDARFANSHVITTMFCNELSSSAKVIEAAQGIEFWDVSLTLEEV